MASTTNVTTVTWSSSASKTVSANTIQWSDAITLNVEDWDGKLSVSVDNAGTPGSGDVCDVYIGWTLGDLLGDSGNDYDSDEHGEYIGRLDTYGSNTPGEDPARKTWDINPSGATGLRVGVLCPQASTRNMTVRALLGVHRPQ